MPESIPIWFGIFDSGPAGFCRVPRGEAQGVLTSIFNGFRLILIEIFQELFWCYPGFPDPLGPDPDCEDGGQTGNGGSGIGGGRPPLDQVGVISGSPRGTPCWWGPSFLRSLFCESMSTKGS